MTHSFPTRRSSDQSGFQVFLADIGLPQAEAGKAKIAKQISRLVEKDKMDAKTAEALLDRIKPVADYAPLAAADLVIEAATEREDIKRDRKRKRLNSSHSCAYRMPSAA